MTTRFQPGSDEALPIMWFEIVTQPCWAEPDPGEGDLVDRQDALFGTGSAHLLVIQGGPGEQMGVVFLAHRDDDGDTMVGGQTFDDPVDAQLRFIEVRGVLQEADPFEGGS